MALFNVIAAPPSAPQIAVPTPLPPSKPPRLDPTDELLLEHLRDAGACPVWVLLNSVTDALMPPDRASGRLLRVQLWDRLKRLRKLGLAFTLGRNRISADKPDPTTRRHVRSRRQTVTGSRSAPAVSAVALSTTHDLRCPGIVPPDQGIVSSEQASALVTEPEQTESAPAPSEITQAARSLARLPRSQPRRLTGWLHGEHCWRGRLVVLPDGERASILWCSRGRILLRNYRDLDFADYALWGARREHQVRFHKSPEAILLGSLKAGVKERPSRLKQDAARRNGCKPVRTGSRPRGRPRTGGCSA
jgi:hypothetical protein